MIKKSISSMDILEGSGYEMHSLLLPSDGIQPIISSWGIDGIVIGGSQVTHAFENPGLYFITPTAENDCSEPLEI